MPPAGNTPSSTVRRAIATSANFFTDLRPAVVYFQRKFTIESRCRSMSSILANLNPEQHRAVTLPRECALILAGAGSGKTRVLTTRIAYLIQTGQVSPSGIL